MARLWYFAGCCAASDAYAARLRRFDRAIRWNPRAGIFHLKRGHALAWLDRWEEAWESYDRAVKRMPEDADVLRFRGIAARVLERYDDALKDLNQVTLMEPSNAEGWKQRGRVCHEEGRYEQAVEDYERAINLEPDRGDLHLSHGHALTWLNRWQDAWAAYDRAAKLLPEDAEPLTWRGVASKNLKKYEDALSDLNRVLERESKYVDAWSERGRVYRMQRRYEEAIADYDRALELAAEDDSIHLSRGHVLTWLDRWEEAWESYNKAVELNPKAVSLRWRAIAAISLGHYEDAHEDLDRAIALKPGIDLFYIQRARVWWWQGDLDAAFDDCHTALTINENSAEAHNLIGKLLAFCNLPEEAINAFDRALEIHPEFSDARLSRGVAWKQLGDEQQALADCDAAIQLDPYDASPHAARAELFRELGDHERAAQDYARALEFNPRDVEFLKSRAECFEELGEYSLADREYEKLEDLREEIEMDNSDKNNKPTKTRVLPLLREHFGADSLNNLSLHERKLSSRIRPDLQKAVEGWVAEADVEHLSGISGLYNAAGVGFTDLMVGGRGNPVLAVPLEFDDLDIGEDEPVRCARISLWLLKRNGVHCAVLASLGNQQVRLQIAVPSTNDGEEIAAAFIQAVERAAKQAHSYRNKVLSLDVEHNYDSVTSGIRVHRLRDVKREDIILPPETIEMLERNVIRFAAQRERLRERGLSTKKGLLFYGPPGTGKTHTIYYLTRAMEGHTTLLITADEVVYLSEYMTLARLLAPSIVIIEDVDLIARERTHLRSTGEECLLNRLLNEMDGLKEDTDIMFILTTNHPESLETALASRPGRIDQSIEFPLPDAEGRAKLARLYAGGQTLSDEVLGETANRTEGVSAAFIKELMRRAVQRQLETDGEGELTLEHVSVALDELLFKGGSLNARLLGGEKARKILGFSATDE